MKKIISILILGVALNGATYNMEKFRKQERILVLKEFKELHEKRKHLYRYSSQTLRSSRAKTLQKRKLSLFQPKNEADSAEALFQPNTKLPIETSNVFYTEIETDDYILGEGSSLGDTSEDAGVSDGGDFSKPVESTDILKAGNLRPTVANPWAKR